MLTTGNTGKTNLMVDINSFVANYQISAKILVQNSGLIPRFGHYKWIKTTFLTV